MGQVEGVPFSRTPFCISLLIRAKIETGISLSPCPVGKDFDKSLALMELLTALENVPSSLFSLPTPLSLQLKRMRFFVV